MVEVTREQAMILENYFDSTGRVFMWFLANSLEGNRILMGFYLEGMFFPDDAQRYLELTRGIDKKLTLVIQYQNEFGDDYRLVTVAKTPNDYNELIEKVQLHAST